MNPIPGWVRILMVVLALTVLYGLIHAYDLRQQGIGEARVRAEWAAADTKRREDEAAERARLDGQRKESDRETKRLQERAESERAAADRAAGQLRRAVTARVDAARAADPAAVGQCAPAGDAIGVLADVLRRADERAGILAAYADAARIAGQQCERDYDALTGSKP